MGRYGESSLCALCLISLYCRLQPFEFPVAQYIPAAVWVGIYPGIQWEPLLNTYLPHYIHLQTGFHSLQFVDIPNWLHSFLHFQDWLQREGCKTRILDFVQCSKLELTSSCQISSSRELYVFVLQTGTSKVKPINFLPMSLMARHDFRSKWVGSEGWKGSKI